MAGGMTTLKTINVLSYLSCQMSQLLINCMSTIVI